MLSPDQPVRVAARLVHRIIGDEVFVLMFDSRIHWLKNPAARTVWEGLVEAGGDGTTARRLARRLEVEYEVGDTVALADTLAFLTSLLEKGLVDSTASGT
ncbi:MAG: PqqD family protein [Myxococcota bacterium]